MNTLTLTNNRPFFISMGIHALFLMTVSVMYQWQLAHQKTFHMIELVNFPEIPKSSPKMSAPKMTRPGRSHLPSRVTKTVAIQSSAPDFSGLLADAKKGAKPIAIKARVLTDDRTDLKVATEKLTQDAKASAISQRRGSSGSQELATLKKLMGSQSGSAHQFIWDEFLTADGNSKTLPSEDFSRIAKILSTHQGEFRDCYEKALLADPDLSGHAKLQLKLGTSGNVDDILVQFSGSGSRSGQNTFSGCMRGVTSRIRFPGGTGGRDLKFGLLLKS